MFELAIALAALIAAGSLTVAALALTAIALAISPPAKPAPEPTARREARKRAQVVAYLVDTDPTTKKGTDIN